MIWGVNKHNWEPWFAWRPVKMIDGLWVWLQKVERTTYWNPKVPVSAHFSIIGTVYRLPEEKKDA